SSPGARARRLPELRPWWSTAGSWFEGGGSRPRTRTRSPATSPLRAGVWPNELAPARLAAAEQGLDRLAPNPLPLVRAEAIPVEQVLSAHDVFLAQVDDPQVRIEPGSDIALLR